MSVDNCVVCEKRISSSNCRNLQCRTCKRLCHPKCARFLPPICIQKDGNYRFEVIRNKKWVCDICSLKELPFSNATYRDIQDSCFLIALNVQDFR